MLVYLSKVLNEAPSLPAGHVHEKRVTYPSRIFYGTKHAKEFQSLDLLVEKNCLVAGHPATQNGMGEGGRRTICLPWDRHAVADLLHNLSARS